MEMQENPVPHGLLRLTATSPRGALLFLRKSAHASVKTGLSNSFNTVLI